MLCVIGVRFCAVYWFFFSSRRRHTRCALVTGVQTCALPICVALAGLDGLLGRQYGTLSGGQQRRVQFALALCGNPRLLFLDEPTTGMELAARPGVWKDIRQRAAQGWDVLHTPHYLTSDKRPAAKMCGSTGGSRGRTDP